MTTERTIIVKCGIHLFKSLKEIHPQVAFRMEVKDSNSDKMLSIERDFLLGSEEVEAQWKEYAVLTIDEATKKLKEALMNQEEK